VNIYSMHFSLVLLQSFHALWKKVEFCMFAVLMGELAELRSLLVLVARIVIFLIMF
jgi:hypothetical protein